MNKTIDLGFHYEQDATAILETREKAIRIHGSGDIKAAGNEIESTVRSSLGNRLPSSVRITHGHIIDFSGQVSHQFDIIIAHSLSAKALLTTEDGTEYVPYEAVLAIGEVKSTYRKTEAPVHAFSEKNKDLYDRLKRQSSATHPIFKFMVFVAKGDADVGHLEEQYCNASLAELPNVTTFLDWGTVFYGSFYRTADGRHGLIHYNVVPTLAREEKDRELAWTLRNFSNKHGVPGANLMFLQLVLVQFLAEIPTTIPNLFGYLIWHLMDGGGFMLGGKEPPNVTPAPVQREET
jgi:hypothetical protein